MFKPTPEQIAAAILAQQIAIAAYKSGLDSDTAGELFESATRKSSVDKNIGLDEKKEGSPLESTLIVAVKTLKLQVN